MFRAVWNVIFFLTLCFIVAKFVLAHLIIWMHANIFFYSYSSLMNCFFSSEILCRVFKFDWLSDQGMKHRFNLYFNEWKLNIYMLKNKGDLAYY